MTLHIRIEEDTMPRLRKLARDFKVQSWDTITCKRTLIDRVLDAYRAEVEREMAQAHHKRAVRAIKERRRA